MAMSHAVLQCFSFIINIRIFIRFYSALLYSGYYSMRGYHPRITTFTAAPKYVDLIPRYNAISGNTNRLLVNYTNSSIDTCHPHCAVEVTKTCCIFIHRTNALGHRCLPQRNLVPALCKTHYTGKPAAVFRTELSRKESIERRHYVWCWHSLATDTGDDRSAGKKRTKNLKRLNCVRHPPGLRLFIELTVNHRVMPPRPVSALGDRLRLINISLGPYAWSTNSGVNGTTALTAQ